MNDPERLLVGWKSELGRAALLSARRDEPPRGSAERAAAAVMGATSVATAAATQGTAAASTSTASAAEGLGLLKAGAIGGFLGIAVVAGSGILRPAPEAPPSPSAFVDVGSRSPAPPRQRANRPIPAPAPASVAAPALTLTTPGPFPSATRPVPREPTLSEELAALDRARSALASSRPTEALSLLEDHDARFPRGALAAETTVLRVEALLGAGDAASARSLADRFVATNPESPYVPRLRSLSRREGDIK